jgi:hypothetical protein
MARPAQITSTPLHVPSILVVMDAVWPELFARCLVAATRSGVLVHRCELPAAATFAAERRPVAIVLSNAVHALDPEEFNALARDVHATLLKVDEEVTERELEAMFTGALRERERREDRDDVSRDDGGRYALIRRTAVETPMPRSTQAPPSVRSSGPPSSRGVPPGAAPRASHLPPPPRASHLPPPSRPFTTPPLSGQGPPSSRGVPPAQAQRASHLPPSSRSFMPPRSTQAPPPSVRAGGPPSVRSPALALGSITSPISAQPPADAGPQSTRKPPIMRTLTPAPATLKSPAAPQAAPPSTPGDPSPRSGVRPHGGDSLDAVFEEQQIPIEGLAQGRGGSAT